MLTFPPNPADDTHCGVHRPRLRAALGLALLATLLSGCAEVVADVGYTAPVEGPSSEGGAALDLRANAGPGPIRFGVAAHSTLASKLQTITLSPEVTLGLSTADVSFGVRLAR